MSKYTDFLKANGATDEELKVLDTPIAQRAYEKMLADSAAIKANADRAVADAERIKTETNDWFQKTAVPEFKDMEKQALTARASEARLREAWKVAQERGLIDVAIAQELGIEPTGTPAKKPATSGLPEGFDPSKMVTTDNIAQLTESVGEGLAALQDLVLEHSQLFPSKPLKIRELRREATAARKPVYQYWEEKFGVSAAREAAETATRTAREEALRKEGREAAMAEFASKMGNPDARPLMTSASPFTKRVNDGAAKQPWERGENQRSDSRVQSAWQKQVERNTQTH